jgi:neurexin
MELLDGYLYMHLDLGSGSLKLRASNRRLDDGAWHKVDLVRNKGRGSLQVDSEKVDFETPGDADGLELVSPLYIGGLDGNVEAIFLPPVLWSAGFGRGFVGCLRDLVINGHTIDVAEFARNQDSGSIRSACHIMPPKCEEKPCMHGGKCVEGWNRFICDCSATSFTGPTCGRGELRSNNNL